MKTDVEIDALLDTATQLFFYEGYQNVTIQQLAEKSNFSPSTLLRRFKTKEGILTEVLERAAQALKEDFLAKIADRGMELDRSDPHQLAMTYLDCALSGWATGSQLFRSQLGILFAFESFSTAQVRETADAFTPDVVSDLDVLEHALARGCGGDLRKARQLSGIIIGTVSEFIYADTIRQVCEREGRVNGYKRDYDANQMKSLISQLLTAAFENTEVRLSSLTDAGISRGSLLDIGQKLIEAAKVIEKAAGALY